MITIKETLVNYIFHSIELLILYYTSVVKFVNNLNTLYINP